MEDYFCHYIKTREDGAIVDGWSSGVFPEKDTSGAVRISDTGDYQFSLVIDGVKTEDNPNLTDFDGIPIYKWSEGKAQVRTEQEISAEREKLPPAPKDPMTILMEKVDALIKNQDTGALAFICLAEKGEIADDKAVKYGGLFEEWGYPVEYSEGQIRRYKDKLYKCVQGHTSQSDWTPDVYQAGWKEIADPGEEWPEWVQPLGAHDAYSQGDKVSHGGKHWQSSIPANVWEPGVYGWDEV